jgi:hypothetical protein
MICTECGAEVPDNMIVCDCFRVAADTEIETRYLDLFVSGGPLFLQCAPTSDHHILPIDGNCLTLCHKKRFRRAETRKLYAGEVRTKYEDMTSGKKPDWCVDCLKRAFQSANAGKTQPVSGDSRERQTQKSSL